MNLKIYNGVLQDCVVINEAEYIVSTYIPSQYYRWMEPWMIYIDNHYRCTIHKIKIEEHTLDAAEQMHKYVIEHLADILRERTNEDEEYW